MIAIIDYGMGNLRSVQKALESVGGKTIITQKSADIKNADRVVLPGVGAMAPAMDKLTSLNLIPAINDFIKTKKPFLGICLGLQLLFEKTDEGGRVAGLGIIEGDVTKFTALKVPHMGWNQLNLKQNKCPLFKNIPDQAEVYFCHSYFVKPKDKSVTATITDYGTEFTSSIAHNNIFGVQFHPEKSQTIGLTFLKNFVNL